jgi:hypothetical protein
MGRLERHLDLDLIARLRSGVKHEPKGLRQQKPPRRAETYRGARRNAAKGSVWRGIKPTDARGFRDYSSVRKHFVWRKGYPRSSEREQARRRRQLALGQIAQ